MENANKQTPATLEQVQVETPNVPRSFNMLEGSIAGTMNAGHYRVIAVKENMASEKIAVEGAKLFIQLMTPRTPAYQKLMAVVDVYHVPHVRVMKDYYKFKAQNGGSSQSKIERLPEFSGCYFPTIKFPTNIENSTEESKISIQETTAWRDNIYSSYITRVGTGMYKEESNSFIMAPPINALLCRGWTAIWNDEIRNKNYETARTEYNNYVVSTKEWEDYMWDGIHDIDFYTARCRRNNSYYTDYRTELQGRDMHPDLNASNDEFSMNWAQFESYFNELRKQAEYSQSNPWDVAQKLSGGKKLTEGRVQKLARKTFPINYSAITQNAYNNNNEIEERYRVMGMQGGYSYTEIDLGFLNGVEIIEDGYTHIVLSIVAETVFESGIERQFINNKWDERYRPDLKDDKLDVIYGCEYGTPYDNYDQLAEGYKEEILGYKRRFNEMFKLPNILNGEIYNRGYYQLNPDGTIQGGSATEEPHRIIPNNTYQFFEYAGQKFQEYNTLNALNKKIWLDYTDVAINKNLAIRQPMSALVENGTYIGGPNQIMYFGTHYCLTDMPIDESIKTNYTKWGEH